MARFSRTKYLCQPCGFVSDVIETEEEFNAAADAHQKTCQPWQERHARSVGELQAKLRSEMEAETAALVEALALKMNEMQAEIDRLRANGGGQGGLADWLVAFSEEKTGEQGGFEERARKVQKQVWPNRNWDRDLTTISQVRFIGAVQGVVYDILKEAIDRARKEHQ